MLALYYSSFQTLTLSSHCFARGGTCSALLSALLADITVKFVAFLSTSLTKICTDTANPIDIIRLPCQHLRTGRANSYTIQTKLVTFFHVGLTQVLVKTNLRSGDTFITSIDTFLNFITKWFHRIKKIKSCFCLHGSRS